MVSSLFPISLLPLGLSPQDIDGIVARMRSGQRARYSGVRRVNLKREGQLIEFDEIVSRDGSNSRTEYRGGPFAGQIVVETSSERRQYLPARRMIFISSPRSGDALGRIARGRRLRLEGQSRLVGREADVLVWNDREGNLRQKAFVDRGTGVVLKRVNFGPDGAMNGGFEFQKIDYSPRFGKGFFTLQPKGVKIQYPRDVVAGLVKTYGFSPRTLPASTGWKLDGGRVLNLGGQTVMVQTYVRQGRRLSLFQTTKIDDAQIPDRERLQRAGVAARRFRADGREFMIVGALSEAELDTLVRRFTDRTE